MHVRNTQIDGLHAPSDSAIALQRSEEQRAKFVADVSRYDPSMLIWIDESGCDRRNCMQKRGYSLRGMTPKDHRLLVRGTRYSAIPVMSLDGIHDVYLAEGNVNGDKFAIFVRSCLLPVLHRFNYTNPHSVIILDNASMHHVQEISDIIEDEAGARLLFLPPYSPDLNPLKEVFSNVKGIMKTYNGLFQASNMPRALLTLDSDDNYADFEYDPITQMSLSWRVLMMSLVTWKEMSPTTTWTKMTLTPPPILQLPVAQVPPPLLP